MLSHHPHKQMSGEKFELSGVHIPNYTEQGGIAFLFRLSLCNQLSYLWSISAMYLSVLCFLLVLLLKMALKLIAEVLCSIPKSKKAVMYLTDKIQLLDKLSSVWRLLCSSL